MEYKFRFKKKKKSIAHVTYLVYFYWVDHNEIKLITIINIENLLCIEIIPTWFDCNQSFSSASTHTQPKLEMGCMLYVNFILQTQLLLSEQGFHHHGLETLKVTIENNAFI